jgi:hypothetical protein
LGGEQQRGGRDQHPGDHGDDAVDGHAQLRARQGEAPGPLGEARGVGLDRPDHQDHHQQRAEQQVEAGEEVGADDLAVGPARRPGNVVDQPACHAVPDLGGGQARW